MKIHIITPAPLRSRKGNGVTALRWVRILRKLGHQVVTEQQFSDKECDVLVALHARRSAESIKQFHHLYPNRPLIVALTGTDLYQDIHVDADAQQSLNLADRLIVLQPKGIEELPKAHQHKARVIYQSIPPIKSVTKNKRTFDICVMGHMRPVKDPFRTALATRGLPACSKIRVLHLGKALSPAMQKRALQEMERNSRYHWLGDLPQWKARQTLAKCRLMVLSSKMEGGANVISEAIVASVPIIASEVSGSIGLLGKNYSGYFPVGDTQKLTSLLYKAETDSQFLNNLQQQGNQLVQLFDRNKETESWQSLLHEFSRFKKN